MATIVSGELLKNKIKNSELIEQGKEENCRGLKYDVVFSGRYLKAKIGGPAEYNEIPIDKRKDMAVIRPGEVIFVITEEIFNLPLNYFAQLTPKRSMGELGINVNGALFVDPGYYGRLVFGLYNFSSENFPLQPRKTFASAVIYELDAQEKFDYDSGREPKQILDFSPDLINTISKCEPIGITELSKVVQEALKDIDTLKQKANTTDNWKKDVERLIENTSMENRQTSLNLAETQRILSNMTKNLEAETKTREAAMLEFEKKTDAEIKAREAAMLEIDKKTDAEIKAREAAILEIDRKTDAEIKAREAAMLEIDKKTDAEIKAREAAMLEIDKKTDAEIKAREAAMLEFEKKTDAEIKAREAAMLEFEKKADAEIKAREAAILEIDRKMEAEAKTREYDALEISKKVDRKMITLQTLGYVVTTIIVGGGGTLLIGWLTGLIHFN
ncbi:MAG: hypothetical protein FWG42_03650 [Clostridiales bacterium]|nr:hypothetical protein [Clostridiales bacterium]